MCRELARNTTAGDGYDLQSAQLACQARRSAVRSAPKLHPHGSLWRTLCDLLLWRWSPQQVARTLQRMHPDDPLARMPTGCCARGNNLSIHDQAALDSIADLMKNRRP